MGILERSLTIKRVPTVLSNYQEEQDGEAPFNGAVGCGRNCLGKCCLPASKLPLYEFKRDKDDNDVGSSCIDERSHPISFLNELLLGQWEERAKRGLFRYDVTLCETKIIPGNRGFIAQLNEGRHLKKRATEFRIDQVLQNFDSNKFNFTKVGQEEALFRFEPSNDQMSHYYPTSSVSSGLDSPNIVAINVSPIEYGHVLLIPRVLDCLPQRIDHASFFLALSMAKEAADPYFRVGYNSLGAFATINHLHFQGLSLASLEPEVSSTTTSLSPETGAYYLQVPFPVEKAHFQKIPESKAQPNNAVTISRLLNYPVQGLVFEGGQTVEELSDTVASACIFLQNNNIPFNVLISGFGKRIFLFPQCYAEKQALGEVSQGILETQVNPAVWEISGHIVLKRREDYDKASEDYAWRLVAEVSLSEERFDTVTSHVLEAIGFQIPSNQKKKKKNVDVQNSGSSTTTVPQGKAVV